MTVAIVLAGGIGVKSQDKYDSLRTSGVPKPLLPVCGNSLVSVCVSNLSKMPSITDVIVVTWWKDLEAVKSDLSSTDMKVRVVSSESNDDTASLLDGLLLGLETVNEGETVMVVPGVMVTLVSSVTRLEGDNEGVVTLYPSEESPLIVGVSNDDQLLFIKDKEEIEFDGSLKFPANKPLTLRTDLIDSGVYLFKNTSSFQQQLQQSDDILTSLSNLKVKCNIIPTPAEKTVRVKTLADLITANQMIARINKLKANNFIGAESLIPDDAVIKNSFVGSHVNIGSTSRIVRSVIMNGATIAPNVVIEDSLICSGAEVTSNVSADVVPARI
jgi:NDP-sugar pyrophosphorylase family protein